METKFLSDGRKVAVLGKLNATESIVQEIFVTDSGVEIPSGENFTTKSLHDEPVKSHKERELERAEQGINKAKQERDKINQEIDEIKIKLSGYRDLFKSVSVLANNIDKQDFTHFLDVITGKVKYAVPSGYPVPHEIEDAMEYMSCIDNYYGRKKYDGLRLMTLLGRSDGRISYQLNRWPDGSGGDTSVEFFNDIESARNYIKSRFMENFNKIKVSLSFYENLRKNGIEFNDEELKKIKEKIESGLREDFSSSQALFEKRKAKFDQNIENLNKFAR
ncbi:hypothetical protein [Proteus sp. G4417]|uniref:hypothetical protein n=1 Tax=Proteus sp. G4417 TaxID=2698862 RepID=UPI001377CCD8|nr:hypothetical protein [Proteus sp. G4417]NBM30600.1 hypothetical protein [Proteus sp. G4417]